MPERDVQLGGSAHTGRETDSPMLKGEVRRFQQLRRQEYQAVRQEGDLRALVAAMTQSQRWLFAADCAAHVLHLFYAKFPDDPTPAYSVRTTRLYALGKASAKELHDASYAARRTRDLTWEEWDARDAARAATLAALDEEGTKMSVTQLAIAAAGFGAKEVALKQGASAKEAQQAFVQARADEAQWQLDRALWYLTEQVSMALVREKEAEISMESKEPSELADGPVG